MAEFSLLARFGMDTTGFKTEIKQLRKETDEFINKWGSRGLIAAGGTFVALSKSAMELAASLKDTSEAVGINVESLQALTYAAEQNGSSADKMQKSLEKTRLTVEKAREGDKESIETLGKLKLTWQELAALPLEKKYERIAKAYTQAEDKAVAYNAVSQLFGEKIGPNMIATLEQLGTEGFDRVAKSAANAGHVMSAQTIVALEKADQAITDFKKRATIAVGNIIVNFRSEEGLKLLGMQFMKVAGMFGAGIVDAITESWQVFKSLFGAAGVWLRERVQNGLVDVAIAFGTMMNKILPKGMQINIGNLEDFRVASEDFAQILAREISSAPPSTFKKEVGEFWDKAIADQQRVVDQLDKVDFGKEAEKLINAGKGIDDSMGKGAAKVETAAKAIKAAVDDVPTAITKLAQSMGMIVTTWKGIVSDFSPLGARGSNQFMDASDEALKEIISRNRNKAAQLTGFKTFGVLTNNFDDRLEAGRLQVEANNAQRELDTRNAIRRSFASGGTQGVYQANQGVDPLVLDKLIQQFALQLPEAQRTANAIESIHRGLVRNKFLPSGV